MKTIKVRLGERTYNIIVGRGIVDSLGGRVSRLSLGSDCLCVTNSLVQAKFGRSIERSLKAVGIAARFGVVPDSEKSKSFEACRRLLGTLAAMDRQKRIFIVALGGGVCGDLAGFCASIYKRGIPYVQVPTTLLAQIDSGIGGKTAIDLAQGKNLVGSFYQPRLVLCDTAALESLPPRQFSSGMAEALKYGIIRDARLFELIERRAGTLGADSPELVNIVARCAAIKAEIVSNDEKETKGERIILNFGHTIGHALEAAAGYGRYSHGEAVAIGMAAACDLSRKLGLLDAATAERIERCLTSLGLPVRAKKEPFAAVMEACLRDKKFKGSRRFVLLSGIGKTRVVADVPLAAVKEAISKRVSGR